MHVASKMLDVSKAHGATKKVKLVEQGLLQGWKGLPDMVLGLISCQTPLLYLDSSIDDHSFRLFQLLPLKNLSSKPFAFFLRCVGFFSLKWKVLGWL